MYRMLIVDDESRDRQGIEFLVRKFGFPLECVQAAGGQKALERLAQEPFHILFTDIQMPKMDGLELIRQALKLHPDLKVILFSAHSSFTYAQTAMFMGVKWYLLKPIVQQEFQQVMSEALDACGKIEREHTQTAVARLLHTGGECGQVNWKYARGLLLAGFDEPVVFGNLPELERLAQETAGEDCLPVPVNEYEMLLFVAEGTRRETAERLMQSLQMKNLDCVTLVVGGVMTTLDELPEQYAEMNARLDYRFFAEGSAILDLSQDDAAPPDAEKSVDALEREILFYFKRRDKLHAKKKLDELFENNAWVHSEMLMKYLATNIARECLHMIGKDEQTVNHCLERLLKSRSVRETRRLLDDLVDEAFADCVSDGKKAVAQLLSIIEHAYNQDISLDELAESLYLTPSYLSVLFKQETGQNFIKYLTNYRIDKARELLVSEDYKINMIGEMVGYANSSYFCQIFKNYYGMTPMQYREQQRGEADE